MQPSKFSGSNLCIEYVRKLCVSNKSVNFCAPFIAMYLYSCMWDSVDSSSSLYGMSNQIFTIELQICSWIELNKKNMFKLLIDCCDIFLISVLDKIIPQLINSDQGQTNVIILNFYSLLPCMFLLPSYLKIKQKNINFRMPSHISTVWVGLPRLSHISQTPRVRTLIPRKV